MRNNNLLSGRNYSDSILLWASEWAIPLGVTLCFIFVPVIWFVSGPVLSVKSSYALFGLLISWSILNVTRSDEKGTDPHTSTRIQNRSVLKISYVYLFGSIALVTYFDSTLVLIIAIIGSYTSILACARYNKEIKISQVVIAFLIPTIHKSLRNKFYFGYGDLLGHTGAIEAMIRSGHIGAISSVYPGYSSFPAYHLLIGISSLLTRIDNYILIQAIGITSFCAVVFIFYKFCKSITGREQISTYVALGFTVLYPVLFYTNYFFPQSMATVLLFYLFYINSRYSLSSPIIIINILLITGIIILHHVSIIIFSTLVVLLGIFTYFSHQRESLNKIPIGVFIFISVVAFLHWVVAYPTIIRIIYSFSSGLSSNLVVDSSGGLRTTYSFGVKISQQTASDALISLLSIDGFYYIILLSLFVSGIAIYRKRHTLHKDLVSVMMMGIFGSIFILKTPLPLPFQRVALFVSFFFAFPIGLTVKRVVSSEKSPANIAIILLLITGSSMAPLTAGDDLYNLHSGPNLYEVYTTPEPQTSFSNREYSQLQQSSVFVRNHELDVWTFTITKSSLTHFGVDTVYESRVSNSSVSSGQAFIYRKRWSKHQIAVNNVQGVSSGKAGNLVISKTWLSDNINEGSRIYATGETGILWCSENSNSKLC